MERSYKKKGDNEHQIKLISINSANDGNGLHLYNESANNRVGMIVSNPSYLSARLYGPLSAILIKKILI
jgi:hypothetical protein